MSPVTSEAFNQHFIDPVPDQLAWEELPAQDAALAAAQLQTQRTARLHLETY
jgi:hypothetical protein